jgi:hypothetical protein
VLACLVGIENRRNDERFPVHLVVSFPNAAEFVTEYIENLSLGGLFIANAKLVLDQEIDVEVRLPGQGEWRVRAKPKFHVDADLAERQRRRAGTGLQITQRPPGFQDALLGYLLRLGRRRDVAVMCDTMPGAEGFAAAGYQIIELATPDAFPHELETAKFPIVAVVVRPEQEFLYMAAARDAGRSDFVYVLATPDQVNDLIARIDALL